MTITPNSVIALDVGEKRVGVAVANLIARLPRALTTLERNDNFFDELQKVIANEQPAAVVVGLPRNMSGDHTGQTRATEAFGKELGTHTQLPIYFQDEALTSQKAETELNERGKPYSKGDVDALAATYILGDFLNDQSNIAKLEGQTND